MERKINNLFEMIEKIGKHNILLILFVFVTFVVTGLYQTFSIYTYLVLNKYIVWNIQCQTTFHIQMVW